MDSNELKEQFRIRVAISNIKKERDIAMENRNLYFGKKSIAVACACLILTTSVTFAKDIEAFIKDKFGLGKGVQTAVENGYIAHSDNDFVKSEVTVTKEGNEEVLDIFDTEVKVNDYLINEKQLNMEFELKFDEKIKKYIEFSRTAEENFNYKDFGGIELANLAIVDEENRLISFIGSEEEFGVFCKEYKLNYTFDDYVNAHTSGEGYIIEIDDSNNLVKLSCNFGNGKDFPKSKHLTLFLNKINFVSKLNVQESKRDITTLTGNWTLNLEIPEVMYNRNEIQYKVVSCKNENFDIYQAKATETGFEIGLIISNYERPIYPEEFAQKTNEIMEKHKSYGYSTKEEFLALYGDEKYEKLYAEYMEKRDPIKTSGYGPLPWYEPTEGCYIENSNGERFLVQSNVPYSKSDFIDDNKYEYYGVFEMTKYDTTDKVTLTIDFCGEPVEIELEKIDE